MKRFVKLFAVSMLAFTVFGAGMAEADRPAKKRKPTFFEQLFGGSSSDRRDRKYNRRGSFWGDDGDIRVVSKKSGKKKRSYQDSDPQGGDSGYGMGNLRYAAPVLASLGGIKLSEARPAEASAAAIHNQLTSPGTALRVLPATRDAVVDTYRTRGFTPVWLEGGTLSERGKAVLALLGAAAEEGLEPEAYLPAGLSSFVAPLPLQDPAAMARLDIDLFAAAVRYARDASGGLFEPAKLSRYHDVAPPYAEAAQAARVLAWSPYAADYLKSLHPRHPAYAAMKKALAELRAKAGPGAGNLIADGPVVKVGDSDPRLPPVRERLVERGYADAIPAPGADATVLDKELSVELRLFQKAMRIKVTGVLGPQTVAALNADSSARDMARLVNSMERLRWLPHQLPGDHVFVNQAAFEAEVVQNGREVWSTRVIVGKPNTQTSVFNDEMELVVFNPSWGVPPSIIANEYLPKLRRDPGYLDRIGFKVVNQKGKVVSSRSVRWGAYGSKVPYGIHQPPGAKNALGEVKFLFPNSHDIYMHDTPTRELFEEDTRAFSHGCVRVQNPREFAAVLLGWDAAEVDKHIGSPKTETVRLKKKIPVYLTYFTAWPDGTGKIRFFEDIYGRDKAMEDARSSVAVAQR